MLPTTADVTIESTLDGEEIAMGIDTASLAFLQKVLTDLYSDPILAVIREYSTNAWDSHVEAGQQRPIEVETPSTLTPFFKVRDYGVGLSIEDMREIYSQYGASTKRGTNAQTGMLGLGCKSALTYTNQFTINSVKDGVKTSVVVSRNADNVGSMQVVFNGPSSEPQGVEISIPIHRKDAFEFQTKAGKFFRVWKPEQVKLNGQAPEPMKGEWLNEQIILTEGRSAYSDGEYAIVMGGVTYNVTRTELFGEQFTSNYNRPNIKTSTGITFFVEMGSIDFTPSREELHYTPRTRAKLKDLVNDFNKTIDKAILDDINLQPKPSAAIDRYMQWSKRVYEMPKDLTYKGLRIPMRFNFDESYTINSWGSNSHNANNVKSSLSNIYEEMRGGEFYIVTGREKIVDGNAVELTTHQKAKLRTWAKANGSSSPSFYFSEKDDHKEWLDEIPRVKWQDILDTKIKRNSSTIDVSKVYIVASYAREEIDINMIDKTKEILWANISDINKEKNYQIYEWATKLGAQVIIVAKNKKKHFDIAFPNAVYYRDWIRQKVAAFNASLTPEKFEVLGFLENGSYHSLVYLDSPEIKDPDLRRLAQTAKRVNDQVGDKQSAYSKLRREYLTIRSMEESVGASNLKRLVNPVQAIDKYPLLGYIGQAYKSQHFKHILLYINAVYENEVQGV
jgi:hypothetical protein